MPSLSVIDDAFDNIDHAFDNIKAEVKKVSNLPAWNEGATITAKMDQLISQNIQIFQHLTTMNANITELKADVTAVTTRLDAVQYNTDARFSNSAADESNSPLVPLQHYRTNEEIPGFPTTPGEVARLNRQEADAILQALGGSTEGTIEKKRLRLRRLLGLPLKLV